MTTTADVTAPPARLTYRQMTLRLGRLGRKGLPGPVRANLCTIAQLNERIAPFTVDTPAVHLYFASEVDLAEWADHFGFALWCDVDVDATNNAFRRVRAKGDHGGWRVYLELTLAAQQQMPIARPRKPAARLLARARAIGRLV